MGRRVFILEPVNKERIDLSSAETKGDVVPLFETWRDRPDIKRTEELSEAIIERLEAERYDPDTDYLCVAGSQALNAVFIAAASSHYAPLNVLLWQNHDKDYAPFVLGLREQEQTTSD